MPYMQPSYYPPPQSYYNYGSPPGYELSYPQPSPYGRGPPIAMRSQYIPQYPEIEMPQEMSKNRQIDPRKKPKHRVLKHWWEQKWMNNSIISQPFPITIYNSKYSKETMKGKLFIPILKFIGQIVFFCTTVILLVPTTIARLLLRFLHDHPVHFNPFKHAHPDIFRPTSTCCLYAVELI